MTANQSPIFGLTPNSGLARVTAANTASDGSGSLVTLFTAGANGSMVFRIRYFNSQATAAASSAMVLRIFQTDTGGANPRLIQEIAIPTATRSTTVIGASGIFNFPNGGLVISTGTLLKVIQSVYAGVQDQMDYVAEGIDY
jgi:hypothetical protein